MTRSQSLHGNVHEGLVGARGCVVDYDVDGPEPLQRLAGHLADLVRVPHIRRDGDGFDAKGAGLLGHPLTLVPIAAVVHHHVGALLGEGQYRGSADVSSRARNEGRLACEFPCHALPLNPVSGPAPHGTLA